MSPPERYITSFLEAAKGIENDIFYYIDPPYPMKLEEEEYWNRAFEKTLDTLCREAEKNPSLKRKKFSADKSKPAIKGTLLHFFAALLQQCADNEVYKKNVQTGTIKAAIIIENILIETRIPSKRTTGKLAINSASNSPPKDDPNQDPEPEAT